MPPTVHPITDENSARLFDNTTLRPLRIVTLFAIFAFLTWDWFAVHYISPYSVQRKSSQPEVEKFSEVGTSSNKGNQPTDEHIESGPKFGNSGTGPHDTSNATFVVPMSRRKLIALYRILGNEMPQRHKLEQTFENLQFILDYEATPDDCLKIFVLNRLINRTFESALEKMLIRANVEYIRIPYREEEYQRIPLDLNCLPNESFLLSDKFSKRANHDRRTILYNVYRRKSNYVMNNNGARNFALRDGKRRAYWVLPWDGNCFVTASGWNELINTARETNVSYFLTPLARATANYNNGKDLETFVQSATEEPQVGFHFRSTEEFDENFYYAFRPKVELLQRLSNKSLKPTVGLRCPILYRQSLRHSIQNNVSWTVRLYSGHASMETNTKKGSYIRSRARVKGGLQFLFTLDGMVGKAHNNLLRFFDHAGLLMKKKLFSVGKQDSTLDMLFREANEAVVLGNIAGSGKSLSEIYNDRSTVKSENTQVASVQHVISDVMVCFLVWFLSEQEKFGTYATTLFRTFFIDNPETLNSKLLKFAPAGGPVDIFVIVDACRLLEKGGFFSAADRLNFRLTLKKHLELCIHLHHNTSQVAQRRISQIGVETLIATISDYLGEHEILQQILARTYNRLVYEFSPGGCQRNRSLADMIAWIRLAQISSQWNIDMWNYPSSANSRLVTALKCVLSNILPGEERGEASEAWHMFLRSLTSTQNPITPTKYSPESSRSLHNSYLLLDTGLNAQAVRSSES